MNYKKKCVLCIILILCFCTFITGCGKSTKTASRVKSTSNKKGVSSSKIASDSKAASQKSPSSDNKSGLQVEQSVCGNNCTSQSKSEASRNVQNNTDKAKPSQADADNQSQKASSSQTQQSQNQKPSNTKDSTRTILIGGMMCNVCVDHIKTALSSIPGVKVESVVIGKAVVTITGDVSDDTLRNAVIHAGDDAGYTVISIS